MITAITIEELDHQIPDNRINFKEQSSITVPTELTIEITESKIRELWCKGIMPDLTYVSFALEFNNGKSLDVSRFASEWSVTELSGFQIEEGWKSKVLKVRSVLNALCILNDKNYSDTDITVKVNQLSLFD